MIEHYFTLAWRQLLKYKLQSVVSIVSLAIGFACFTMAAIWIKYEMTYDGFHKDADGIYALVSDKQLHMAAIGREDIEQWPEVSEFTIYTSSRCNTINDQLVEVSERLILDSCYLSIFYIKFLEGGSGFLHDEGQVAISDNLAKRLFGDESPIGKELRVDTELPTKQRRMVTGVFKSWGEHTNNPFELLSMYPTVLPPRYGFAKYCMMRLHPNVNVDTLNARLANFEKIRKFETVNGKTGEYTQRTHSQLVPITKVRHSTIQYEQSSSLKVEHIYLFACAGLLLIVCGLLNYLTMFINRLFIRQREIALRTVFGATGGNMMVQFLVEYGMLLLIAMYFGRLTLESSLEWFRTMAELPTDIGYIYRETWFFMSIVVLVSLLVSVPAIWYFRRQSLRSSITGIGGLTHYNTFRRISTGFQIGIAIFSIFCVVVMLKQVDTLRHEDIGFKRENIGYQEISGPIDINIKVSNALADYLKQQPEVDTVIIPSYPIYPRSTWSTANLVPEDYPQFHHFSEAFEYKEMEINETTARFYGMTLIEGEWPDPYKHGPWSAAVSESFVRLVGWENPIGQEIGVRNIVGVFKDVYNGLPTQRVEPLLLVAEDLRRKDSEIYRNMVLFQFKPGSFPILKQKIEELYKKNGWEQFYPTKTLEATYERMLKSEKNLQKLLNITTIVCILIALFGVWSMIMLTCEQRRKEIAIRKVFGATVKDILDMFFLEYMTLQGVAALVAFPVGYACMKPWLEQYVVQTEISWWIYVGIFMAVALLVALCIGWRVWKTATARPADEICKG